jgi:hypothetical protein
MWGALADALQRTPEFDTLIHFAGFLMSCCFVAGLASHVSRRAGFHVPARRMTVSFGMRLQTCSFHVGFPRGSKSPEDIIHFCRRGNLVCARFPSNLEHALGCRSIISVASPFMRGATRHHALQVPIEGFKVSSGQERRGVHTHAPDCRDTSLQNPHDIFA